MATHARRLEEGFPTIYLTLYSIVIALALEKLIDRVQGLAAWPLDAERLLIWLLAGGLFTTVFLMWLLASYTVLALRWDLSWIDAVTPFFVLVLFSAAIASIGHGRGEAFFIIAAVGQGTGNVVFRQVMREAAERPENEVILRNMDWRWFYLFGALTFVVPATGSIGLLTGVLGLEGALWFAGLLLVLMVATTVSFGRTWWRSVRMAAAEEQV